MTGLYDDITMRNVMALGGTKEVAPTPFEGFLRGTGNLTMRALATAGRSASMGFATLPILADAVTGGTVMQDRYFKDVQEDVFQSAVDRWSMKPNEVGIAAEIAGGVLGTGLMILASPAGAVVNQFTSSAEDLIRENPDVSLGKALAVGGVQAAGLAAGIVAPPALGYNLWSKMATGAGINWLQGVVTRGASGAVVEGTSAEKKFEAFGLKDQFIDLFTGTVFGAAAQVMPSWRLESDRVTDRALSWRAQRQINQQIGKTKGADAQAAADLLNKQFTEQRQAAISSWQESLTPTQKAAVAAARVEHHLTVDSRPGRPTHDNAGNINRDALLNAIDSLLKDKRPDVSLRVGEVETRPVPETPTLRDLSDTALRPVGDVLPITQSMVPPRDWEIMTRLGLVQEGKVGDQTLQFVEPQALAAERTARADDDQTQPINDRIARVENQIQDAETVLEAARYSEPDKVGQIETKLDMLNERLASLKEERPDFEVDPERTTQAVETTRAMTDGVRETAGDDGIPPPPEVVEPIETVVERGLLEAGRTADEAKVGATIWRETFKSWSVATGLDPDALFHRYMKGITGQAQPAADALAQGPVRESPAARIEEYRPEVKTSRTGLPIFQNKHVALGQPRPAESKAQRGKRVVFMIFDMERGTPAKVGYVIADIDPATNTFLALRNIKIDDAVQNMGHGEKAVATMLAHNGDKPMEIVDITHAGEDGIGSKTDALPRWKKWGTVLRNYSTNPDIQMDGVLTKEAYINARRYQQGRSGSGTQAAAPDRQGYAGGARGDRGTAPTDADRAELARLNGTLFQGARPTETPAFKAWFRNSKVVDADGNPQVVYHGTTANFDTFDHSWNDLSPRGDTGGAGFFFSPNAMEAGGYAWTSRAQTGNVMPVYLSIKNPYRIDAENRYSDPVWNKMTRSRADAKRVRSELQEQGYDGILTNLNEWVAFKPEQIKSAIGNRGTFDPNNPNILYQDSPWYYSALGRAIDNSPTKAADANGWKQWLKGLINKGTVKADEIKATELEEYLDATQGKITKEQLQTFMQEGGVRVEEVELGATKWNAAAAERMVNLEGKVNKTPEEDAELLQLYEDRDNHTIERETSGTRFANFQLPGAKDGSYREIALVLPRRAAPGHATGEVKFDPMDEEYPWVIMVNGREVNRSRQGGQIADDILAEMLDRENEFKTPSNNYRVPQGHSMGDKADTNRIAHIRFNERTGTNGERVLFIEEIQSDWAQQGKKQGFDQANKPRYSIKEGPPDDDGTPLWLVLNENGESVNYHPTRQAAERAMRQMEASQGNRGVPSGPFVGKTEAWVALSMKRMIRYAAENGFDQIAWTTGAQQADRYDLSKQVQSLSYFKNKAGAYEIKVIPVGRGTEWQTVARDVAPEKLEDYVGKETAQKIIDGAGNKAKTGDTIMTGIDLKIGGEGMKGFYDKIVPTVAKDVLKKLGGGKVEQVELEMPKGKPTQYADYAAWQAAESGYSTQQAITITPEMRAKVMEGQALFQKPAQPDAAPRGFLNIEADRKMTIGLLLAADKSTFKHESAHFFLEVMDDLAKDHPALEADMQVLFKEWGVTREQWNSMTLDDKRVYHEQFARWYEAYLMTNRAPSEALRDAFRKFRDWLIAIYKSASNLNVKVSAEVRQLMDRMLSAEQREKATTQAATDGSPPPPPPPEASPGTGGMFDDLVAERPPFEARTIEDQDVREILRTMAENETGWAQIGGRNLTGETGVFNRSTWIPKADWWLDRPDNIKKLKEPEYYAAVAKALVGDKLKPIEQRAVDFMIAKANEHLKVDYELGRQEADALTQELIEADLEPTAKNIVDADAVAIAHQINPAEVERLAMEHQDDDAAFVAEIARMIDEHQNSQAAAGRDEGQPAPAEPAKPAARADGAGEAPDPLSLEADRIAAELGDQPMEITMPDGSTRTMTAAEYLADARESAAMAREDIALINEAAQCLLGAV